MAKTVFLQLEHCHIHLSKYSTQLVFTHNVNLLDFPSRAPDLNSIEKQWAVSARRFHYNTGQFDCIDDQKEGYFWKVR